MSIKSSSSSEKSTKRNSSVSSLAFSNGFFVRERSPRTINCCLNNSAPAAQGDPSLKQ